MRRDYDYDYDDYSDEPEEEEVCNTDYRVVRKPRKGFLPGDLIRVTSGFTYEPEGGPRTGYFSHEILAAYGPNHGPNKVGKGAKLMSGWPRSKKGSYEAYHGTLPQAAIERDELLRRANGYNTIAKGNSRSLEYITQTREQLEALEADIAAWSAQYGTDLEWDATKLHQRIEGYEERIAYNIEASALLTAKPGQKITWKGEEVTRGEEFTKVVYFSDMEYNGHLCDAEAQGWVRLISEQGEVTSMRLPRLRR